MKTGDADALGRRRVDGGVSDAVARRSTSRFSGVPSVSKLPWGMRATSQNHFPCTKRSRLLDLAPNLSPRVNAGVDVDVGCAAAHGLNYADEVTSDDSLIGKCHDVGHGQVYG